MSPAVAAGVVCLALGSGTFVLALLAADRVRGHVWLDRRRERAIATAVLWSVATVWLIGAGVLLVGSVWS